MQGWPSWHYPTIRTSVGSRRLENLLFALNPASKERLIRGASSDEVCRRYRNRRRLMDLSTLKAHGVPFLEAVAIEKGALVRDMRAFAKLAEASRGLRH